RPSRPDRPGNIGGSMRRQKKFYAWGYADEDLSADEIKAWEAEIAQRYGLNGFDVTPPPTPDEITLRASRIAVPAALQSMVHTDHLTRLEHSYGKAGFDTTRMFMRSVPNPPDAVAFPENEQDIVRLFDWCDEIGAKAIPYGGGSSVVKGIEPPAAAEKVVTISTRHMDKVLEVDPVSQAARIQGGIYGPAIEDQLRDTPFTMRHYMQAYRCSTLGGWIATRSGGHYATLYTHIDDFVESLPGGTRARTLETRCRPGSGAGPSPDRMFLGSEGILGIITEAWVRLRKKPTFRTSASVRFKTFFDGADAVRDITQAGLYPANCRLLEAREALPGIPWSSEQAEVGLDLQSRNAPRRGGGGRGNVREPWRRGRSQRRGGECASLGGGRRLAQPLHPCTALRRARGGARHSLLDFRDLDDLGAHARLPSEDHQAHPGHHQTRHR